MTSPVALGLRAHSGWAALVAISGPTDSPTVIDRRIIQLANPETRGSKQPYHAAEPLPFPAAAELIARCSVETHNFARRGLEAIVATLQEKSLRIVGCGLLLNAGRALPSLERILASHALIHAAEGQLFRDALAQAAAECGLAVTGIKERELLSKAAMDLQCPPDRLQVRLADMGRTLGPPWREDQKKATLAAWIVLAATTLRPAKSAAMR